MAYSEAWLAFTMQHGFKIIEDYNQLEKSISHLSPDVQGPTTSSTRSGSEN